MATITGMGGDRSGIFWDGEAEKGAPLGHFCPVAGAFASAMRAPLRGAQGEIRPRWFDLPKLYAKTASCELNTLNPSKLVHYDQTILAENAKGSNFGEKLVISRIYHMMAH